MAQKEPIEFKSNREEWGEFFSAERRIGKQTARIGFCLDRKEMDKTCYWFVEFQIYTKRKHIERNYAECRMTGECGVEGLLFAKDAILEFSKWILTQRWAETGCRQVIVVWWADNIRKKIYCHFLPRYGFKLGRYDNHLALLKEIT